MHNVALSDILQQFPKEGCRMSFVIYAGCAGRKTQDWHRDCGAAGTPMAVDIGVPAGTEVYFRIENRNQDVSQRVRYKYDCAWSYVPGQVSTLLVLVEDAFRDDRAVDLKRSDVDQSLVRHYVFRYVQVIPDPSVTSSLSTISWVSPGQTREFLLGRLSTASLKDDPPVNPPGDDRTWLERCSGTAGRTDNAGHCSSGAHLHQAASNGNDECLKIDINGHCNPSSPLTLTTPGRTEVLPDVTATSAVLVANV